MTIIALADGSYIFLGFIVLALGGLIFGYFTYEGSGINAHPSKEGGGTSAPGSSGPSSAGGKGRTGDEATDDDVNGGGAFESHGTK